MKLDTFSLKKEEISKFICYRIEKEVNTLRENYKTSSPKIGYFYIDDLLPEEIAKQCFSVFPSKSDMNKLDSLRERKFISAQMDSHHELLESVIYAFQAKEVVEVVKNICDIESLYPDESLYAGGISLMEKEDFLNPHLDNSHDADRKRWRVLNLLYYVTPNWKSDYGGHLELWPNGVKNKSITIESKFNRLVVMATHDASWHSVSKVKGIENRCCISNYYFSDNPLRNSDRFHVTRYRGRPGALLTDAILTVDGSLRMIIRRIFKKGIRKNPHYYKKKNTD